MTVPPVVWRHRSRRSTCGRRSRYRAATAPAGAGSRRAGADRGTLTDSTAASRSSTNSTGTFPSASLERPDRTVSRASDARNRYKIRYTRNQERLASLQVKTHDRVFGTHRLRRERVGAVAPEAAAPVSAPSGSSTRCARWLLSAGRCQMLRRCLRMPSLTAW